MPLVSSPPVSAGSDKKLWFQTNGGQDAETGVGEILGAGSPSPKGGQLDSMSIPDPLAFSLSGAR